MHSKCIKLSEMGGLVGESLQAKQRREAQVEGWGRKVQEGGWRRLSGKESCLW